METTAPLSTYDAGEKILEILAEEEQREDVLEENRAEGSDPKKEDELHENESLENKTAPETEESAKFIEDKVELLENIFLEKVDRFEGIDWKKMEVEHPEEYQKMMTEKTALNEKISQFLEVKNSLKKNEYEKRANLASKEQAILKKKMGWENPQKESLDRKEILAFIKKQGLQERDLNNLLDHRHIILLHKAMLYDRAQEAKKEIAKPKAALFQKPKLGSKEVLHTAKTKRLEKLKRSGSVYDAAEVLMDRI
ncbi:MAG: hypothetical protein ACTSXQ_00255 [Alphaproteobacteria bacterium]